MSITVHGRVLTASQQRRAASFYRQAFQNRSQQLSLVLEWLGQLDTASAGYQLFYSGPSHDRWAALAPTRWLAGAEEVLELQDIIAMSEPDPDALQAVLTGVLEFADLEQARMLITHLCSERRAALIAFLCGQGWRPIGKIPHYYAPFHHQIILTRTMERKA